jgi:hypothetical protein
VTGKDRCASIATRAAGVVRRRFERGMQEVVMTRRSLRRTVAWSTLLAVTVQLALAAATAAATGGADWPLR